LYHLLSAFSRPAPGIGHLWSCTLGPHTNTLSQCFAHGSTRHLRLDVDLSGYCNTTVTPL
jgi:hypothetical protein